MTVIRTRAVGAGRTLNKFRQRVQGQKPFRKRRSEEGEGGEPDDGGQMSRSGTIADEGIPGLQLVA